MKLTFFKEWIESDPFQTFTKETESIPLHPLFTSDASSEILTSNNGSRVWAVPLSSLSWPRATNSPILPSIYEKSESPLWRQINKASSSSEQSLVNSAISADLCGKKIVLRFPAKGRSLIVIPNGSRHWSSTIIRLRCVPFAVRPSSDAESLLY